MLAIRQKETEAASNSSVVLNPLLHVVKCEILVVHLQLLSGDSCGKRLFKAVDPVTLVVMKILYGRENENS